MSEFVTTAAIREGKLGIRNRKALEQWAERQKDGEYTLTVERAHATRSLEQNALYHVAFVRPLSEHTGYSVTEMHEYLKARFLPAAKRKTKTLLLHDRNGVVIDEREIDLSTTTSLNRVEFSEYLHEIQVFAATLGVEVGSHRDDSAPGPRVPAIPPTPREPENAPARRAGDSGRLTHWSYLENPNGKKYVALCGAVVLMKETADEPTCPRCAELLREKNTEDAEITAGLQADGYLTREGHIR